MTPITTSVTMPLPWPVMTLLARKPAMRPISTQTRIEPGSNVTDTSASMFSPPSGFECLLVGRSRAAGRDERDDLDDHCCREHVDDHRKDVCPDDQVSARRGRRLEDAGERCCESLPDREHERRKPDVVGSGCMEDEVESKEHDDDPGDEPDELNPWRPPRPNAGCAPAHARPGGWIGGSLGRGVDTGPVRTVARDGLALDLRVGHVPAPLWPPGTEIQPAEATRRECRPGSATIAVTAWSELDAIPGARARPALLRHRVARCGRMRTSRGRGALEIAPPGRPRRARW